MKEKLSAVVGIFLDEIQGGQAEYARCYRMAIRGFKELDLDITAVPKTVMLEVSCDKTADLPDDFIKDTNLGVLNEKGEIASLTRNDNLITDLDDCAIVQYQESDFLNFENDDTFDTFIYQQSYGKGSYNTIGEFKIDTGASQIVLDPDFKYTQILLEYVAREQFEGEYLIDVRLVDALVAYIRWRYNIGKKGVGFGTAQAMMQEYLREKSNARYRIKVPTISDMNQNSRIHTKMSLKS
jgi:hypothetical protein